MNKRTTILSLGYWFSATTLGMLLHPYKSVREIVRQSHLRILVLAPMVWGGIFWLGAVTLILMGRILAGAGNFNYPQWLYGGLEVIFWWAVWFLLLWQGLVGYLYLRFTKVIGVR